MTQSTLSLVQQPTHPEGTFMQRNPELRELIATSGITADEIAAATEKTRTKYNDLNVLLSAGHGWRDKKLLHALQCGDDIVKYAPLFGLEGVECDVFKFILFAHDIGRLMQGILRERGENPDDETHGALGVTILREALGLSEFNTPPVWNMIFAAIAAHSLRTTPTLEQLGGFASAHALAKLARDTDKKAAFDEAKSYTGDPSRQGRERV
ncbi:MAG: hypothetical protein WC895_05430, partial [Candidatus Shapirobacteria bacterium]